MPLADPRVIEDPRRLEALRRTRLLDAPPEEAFDRLTRLASRMIGAPIALVSLVDAHRQFLTSAVGLSGEVAETRETPISHSFCQHVVATGGALVIGDARMHPLLHDNPAITDDQVLAYAGTPIRDRDGVPLGSFCVADNVPRVWTDEQVAILTDLAEAVMTEVNLRLALQEEVRRSRTDPLTGVANRRAMRDAVEAELLRGSRQGTRTGVLLIDVDHFKRVNDTHGHAAGDAVLLRVATAIRESVRAYDVVARWGGEEFAVLLPAIPDEAALVRVGDAVRTAVAAAAAVHEGTALSVRVSVGCALAAPGQTDVDTLVDTADRALYAAKRRGRDRCVASSDLRPQDEDAETPDAVRVAMALSRAAGMREGVSDIHCNQVADLAVRLARVTGRDPGTQLRCRLAGWLHDVGKIALPEEILLKPGPLTDAERLVMQSHPIIGAQIIADLPDLRPVAPAVRHHHEWFDGSGYPDGLAGAEIPIEARIIAVADAFSAMTSDRVYRRQVSRSDAMREMVRCRGTQFDPELIDALEDALADVRGRRGGRTFA